MLVGRLLEVAMITVGIGSDHLDFSLLRTFPDFYSKVDEVLVVIPRGLYSK